MRKYISVLLVFILLITVLPVSAFAETNDPLWDVEKGKWYYKDIHEVYAREMIQGKQEFGTVSFKPNDPVSQNEALIMLLRYLDVESVINQLSTQDINTRLAMLNISPDEVKDWAKGHIAYAITRGFIKSKNDTLNINATRLWVAQLLVRILEKESVATSADMMRNTGFADDSTIMLNYKGYVNTVVELGLLKGQSENGVVTFNPTGAITRAEMATILLRLDEHTKVKSNYSETVVIKSLTEESIEFQNSDGKFVTLEMNNPTVFVYGNKASLRDLNTYDLARIAVRNDKIVFIDVNGKGTIRENVVYGTFEKVDTDSRLIWVIQDEKNIDPYTYNSDLVIKDTSGKMLTLTDLKTGMEVKVTLADDNQTVKEIILKIAESDVETPSVAENMVGTFVSIDVNNQWLTLQLDNGKYKTYPYTEETYLIYEGVRFPKLTDLVKGDRIRLSVTDYIVQIEVLSLAQENVVGKGIVVSLSDKPATITLNINGQIQAYPIDANVVLQIPGTTNPTLSMLKEGYEVEFEVLGGKVTKLTVQRDALSKEIKGRFVTVDLKKGILNYVAENGELMAKKISDQVYVEMEGTKRTLTDLAENMRLILTVKDDVITEIVLDNYREGTIKSINTNTQKIVITTDQGDAEYTYLTNLSISMYGVINPKIKDVLPGQFITFYITEKDEIKSMTVQQTLNYTVLDVDVSKKTLSLIRNGNKTALVYSDDVELIVDGKPAAIWTTLKGKPIEATFLGKKLIKVEKK